jgi:hypothetical protein
VRKTLWRGAIVVTTKAAAHSMSYLSKLKDLTAIDLSKGNERTHPLITTLLASVGAEEPSSLVHQLYSHYFSLTTNARLAASTVQQVGQLGAPSMTYAPSSAWTHWYSNGHLGLAFDLMDDSVYDQAMHLATRPGGTGLAADVARKAWRLEWQAFTILGNASKIPPPDEPDFHDATVLRSAQMANVHPAYKDLLLKHATMVDAHLAQFTGNPQPPASDWATTGDGTYDSGEDTGYQVCTSDPMTGSQRCQYVTAGEFSVATVIFIIAVGAPALIDKWCS